MSELAGCESAQSREDYERRSPATEASEVLHRIGMAARRVFKETGSFPQKSAALLPHSADHCCGTKNGCSPVIADFKADPGWSALQFSIDEPVRYQYSYNSDGKSFTAYAVGDLDCDHKLATFTMTGVVMANGNPAINIIPPPSGVY